MRKHGMKCRGLSDGRDAGGRDQGWPQRDISRQLRSKSAAIDSSQALSWAAVFILPSSLIVLWGWCGRSNNLSCDYCNQGAEAKSSRYSSCVTPFQSSPTATRLCWWPVYAVKWEVCVLYCNALFIWGGIFVVSSVCYFYFTWTSHVSVVVFLNVSSSECLLSQETSIVFAVISSNVESIFQLPRRSNPYITKRKVCNREQMANGLWLVTNGF